MSDELSELRNENRRLQVQVSELTATINEMKGARNEERAGLKREIAEANRRELDCKEERISFSIHVYNEIQSILCAAYALRDSVVSWGVKSAGQTLPVELAEACDKFLMAAGDTMKPAHPDGEKRYRLLAVSETPRVGLWEEVKHE